MFATGTVTPAQAGASLPLMGVWVVANLKFMDAYRDPRLRGDDILFRGDEFLYV